MPDARHSADALLTEHFRYTPLSLIDDVINTINAIVYRALQAIESGLLNTPPAALGYAASAAKPDGAAAKAKGAAADKAPKDAAGADAAEVARAEIEHGVHQLETLLEASVDRTFDKFELYALRHLLSVDEGLEDWIRLAHYEDLNIPAAASAPTPDSILALRQQLAASRALNLALADADARAAALLADVQSLLTPPSATAPPQQPPPPAPSEGRPADGPPGALAFLAPHLPAAPPGKGPGPLATAAQFATSQLPALRALLAELRPRAQALAAAAVAEGEEDGSPREGAAEREARRGYIEGATRRVVRELVGEVEGDAGRGLGRDIGAEEVETLEALVGDGALGRQRPAGPEA